MDGEEYRTGSADSENSSDNSYVKVTPEEVQEQLETLEDPTSQQDADAPEFVSRVTGTGIPSGAEDEDIYNFSEVPVTGGEKSQDAPQPTKVSDPFFMESHDPEEEEKRSSSSSPDVAPPKIGGIEDVGTVPMVTTDVTVPKATGLFSFLNSLHPLLLYLIYWKDPKLTAVKLGVDLVVILTLTLNTFLHTVVLLLLSFLVVSLTYIITKIAIDSFYNREIRNPFGDYLSKKITLPEEKIIEWTRYFIEKVDGIFNLVVRLLLFDNIKQSLKFGVFLWLISFITNYFTLLTTLFLVDLVLFVVPPIYSKYQTQIDQSAKEIYCKVAQAIESVKARIPSFLMKMKAD